MAPTGFVHLPTETLQTIFSFFCVHCREKHHSIPADAYFRGTQQRREDPSWYSQECHTLFSLCLVSRRFHHIAQSILYHQFMPGYGDSWLSDLYSWNGRLDSFFRTVTERPDLAALVMRIYIHPYLMRSINTEGKPYGYNQVTTLIEQLPNLGHCSLQVNRYEYDRDCCWVPQDTRLSPLPLRTIDISLHATAWQESQFSLDRCARGLCKASTYLETLNLHMCDGQWRWTPFPSLPNLKTLRITHSRVDDAALEGLLSSCNSLHTFIYETHGCPTFDRLHGRIIPQDGSNHFRSSNAVKYLQRHRATLNNLHLDLRDRTLCPAAEDKFSFQDFPVLEHLLLNACELYSWWTKPSKMGAGRVVQILPPSIVSLHLAGHIGRARDQLTNGLLALARATSQNKFPRLQEVRCDEEQKTEDDDDVSANFAAAGVTFGYESWPKSDATLNSRDFPRPPTPPVPLRLPLPDEEDPDL